LIFRRYFAYYYAAERFRLLAFDASAITHDAAMPMMSFSSALFHIR